METLRLFESCRKKPPATQRRITEEWNFKTVRACYEDQQANDAWGNETY